MWALEETCTLRRPGEARWPREAIDAVARARAFSDSLRNKASGFGIFGDVYVSGHTFGHRPKSEKKQPSPPYPSSGFLISEEFGSLEGPSGLFAMCGKCRANTTSNEIAGCCGTLSQWPDSPETEDQIRSIISRLRLERELEESFPRTTPIWYGLWAVSPVPSRSLGLLRTIISTMRDEDAREMEIRQKVDKRQLQDFALFAMAAEIAEQRNIPLHVVLLPLGHTDFGIYTTFPHCPFCKAAARIERWQRKYPAELYDCRVCGRRYSPAETASSRRMEYEQDELRDLLGPSRFVGFAKVRLLRFDGRQLREKLESPMYERS
jgi:hypothetical protein